MERDKRERMWIENQQSGAALVVALLMTALVSIMAVALISRQQLEIRRTANIVHGDQAVLLAKGVEAWVALLLGRSSEQEVRGYLGQELPPMPVAGGAVGGRIEDQQGLFNLNNLVLGDEEQREFSRLQFRRLLASCDMSADLEQAVTDWLDADQEPLFPGGAEDGRYLGSEPAFRTADQPMVSASELRQVEGFAGENYENCLQPLLCALPAATTLNVNTAPARLLFSLSDALDLSTTELLVRQRPTGGYEELSDFLAQEALAGTGLQEQFLDVDSRFFMVISEAATGQGRASLFSLLEKKEGKAQVLRRSLGTF